MTVPPIESWQDLVCRMSEAILHAVGAWGQRTGTTSCDRQACARGGGQQQQQQQHNDRNTQAVPSPQR
jgi:hypothetical protein